MAGRLLLVLGARQGRSRRTSAEVSPGGLSGCLIVVPNEAMNRCLLRRRISVLWHISDSGRDVRLKSSRYAQQSGH